MIGELTNHLWQSTILAVVAGLLAAAFRKNRAQVRYWLWLSASLKFLIPFSLLIGLGNILRDALAPGKMTAEIAPPAVARTVAQITQPFPDTVRFASPAPHSTSWIPVAILGVWACGFAAIALMRFRGWLRIRAALRASSPIDTSTTVAVRSSRGLLEPGIVGFLRPILILPEGILKSLTPSQLEAVLAHELTHVRRRDNLTAAIHMVVEAVFWFYPLVWWIGARLVEERERACDEAVLSLGSEPRAYADAIVSVCRLYVESPLLCVSGIGGYDLKRRLARIMGPNIAERLTSRRKVLLGGAVAAAFMIPLALGMIGASNCRALRSQEESLPSFETASIKVSTIPRPQLGFTCWGNGFASTNTAYRLIQLSYGDLKPAQVSGGPDWIKSKVFDIEATVDDSLVNGEWKKLAYDERCKQVMLMLRSLLLDRFKLRVRHETKELPVYVLLLAEGGPKFAEDDTQAKNERIEGRGAGAVAAVSAHLSLFVHLISRELGDEIILDKTGLQGRYSFTFDWQRQPGILEIESSRLALAAALQNQLGLRLESAKAPADTIVIENIEQPTGN